MTLFEALTEIIKMKNVDLLVPKQVYSIISDYGVFKETPKLQTILKVALQNGLWDIVKSPFSSSSKIEALQNKLVFHGFSDNYIKLLFAECGFNCVFCIGTTNVDDSDQNRSNCQLIKFVEKYNPLSDSSSHTDIENYLNSILEIDQKSFQKYGLILQKIQPIEWRKGAGYYRDEFGACFSLEVIGNKKFQGDVEVEVYDLKGFLRNIRYIASIHIDGKYSITNETVIKDLTIPPQNISKIVLRIGIDGVHLGNAFYDYAKSILCYEGNIENETEKFDILYTQILYAEEKEEDNISVFFRYEIKQEKKKNPWTRDKNLYIVLFDRNGLLRQRIALFDYRNIFSR